jgi:hypothetical protein
MRSSKGQIGVTVRFGDGRSARLLDSAGLKSGLGPVVMARGGKWGGHRSTDDDFDLSYTVWPLPPNGPMTLTFDWRAIGIKGSEVTIDGELARRLGISLRGGYDTAMGSGIASQSPRSRPTHPVVPLLVGMDVRPARLLARRSGGLRIEQSDPDRRPLAIGVIVEQEPEAGTVVEPFSTIRVHARDSREDPPSVYGLDAPGGDGGPSGGVREPRKPTPSGNGTATEVSV